MPVVQQLTVTVANRPGQLARVCEALAAKKINITGLDCSGSARQVRLLVSRPAQAARILEKGGWKPKVEDALLVTAADRPGALARIARQLAKRGININYGYASATRGSKRAAIVLGVSNARRAARWIR